MDRRKFLELSAKSLSFLALSELLTIENALAQSATDEFLVQINLPGGWDVTLGIDPWLAEKPDEKDLFIEYDSSAVTRAGNTYFGPAMSSMMPFASNMSVINGVFLSAADNGHQAAEQYILSGTVNQNWGSLVVEYNECRGEGFLGVLNNGTVSVGSRSSKLTPISNLMMLGQSTSSSDFRSAASRANRLEGLEGDLLSEAEKITKFQAITAFLKQTETVNERHYMAAALAAGLSKTAAYTAAGGFLDTHSGHVGTHLQQQKLLWEDIATVFNIFKKVPYGEQGQSLFDRTTFFITSEFSRTAALNNSGGKDHNPIANSVMIVSPHVRNTTIGGTHLVTRNQSKTGMSYHISSPIDLNNGQPVRSKQNAFIIRPENIAATVVELLGVSRRRFAAVDPKVRSLAHLLRR